MPLSSADQIRLYQALSDYRDHWNDAETLAAVKELAKQEPDAATLHIQAWVRARSPRNERATSITWPLESEAVVRQLPARLPEQHECPEHGGTITDDEGRFSCCKFADAEPLPAFQRSPSVPPPGVRQTVAAALHRKDREK